MLSRATRKVRTNRAPAADVERTHIFHADGPRLGSLDGGVEAPACGRGFCRRPPGVCGCVVCSCVCISVRLFVFLACACGAVDEPSLQKKKKNALIRRRYGLGPAIGVCWRARGFGCWSKQKTTTACRRAEELVAPLRRRAVRTNTHTSRAYTRAICKQLRVF